MKNPFKAYDIRGVFGKEIIISDIVKIGLCTADLLKEKISIGMDARTTSPALKSAFISGFISRGYDLIDIGMVPTPVSNYYGLKHKVDNVTITGSHTSAENNGIKFFDKRGVTYNKRLKIIEEKYLNHNYTMGTWEEIGKILTDKNAIKEYIENIKSKITLNKKLKIVMDHGNGTSGVVAPKLLTELGCKVINISKEPNGLFPNRIPEPKSDNLGFLKKRVVEEKADFGVAYDGDADRSVFVDDKGRVLDGSVMGCVFTKSALKNNPNAYIVASIDTSSILKTVVEENDGIIVWCPVGMKNIENGLVENKGMFASEVSSHFYFNDFYAFSDGILSTCKLAQILNDENKKLSEIVETLPKYPIKHSKYYLKNHIEKFEKFDKLKSFLKTKYEINDIDGVKFFLNQTDWILIRPSNTEPVIRLTVEAINIESMENNFKEFEELIKKFINNE